MKSFQDLVCPGHYKVTMGHHLLLRSPKESLKHWALLIISIEPGGLTLQEKVEKANQFLKSVIKKITQETSLRWKKALPIALLCTHIAPKKHVGFSPYEMLYGKLFLMSMISSQIQRLRSSCLTLWHWTIPTRYMFVGCQPGPKRF